MMFSSALSSPPPYRPPAKKREQNVRFSDDLEIIPQPVDGELSDVPGQLNVPRKHISGKRYEKAEQAEPNETTDPPTQAHVLGLRGCLRVVGRWLISDYVVLILILLTLCLIGFSVAVVGWAGRDLEGLCKFNPQLTRFYNGLWPAFITILPGCLIATLLLPSMARTKRSRPNALSRRGWTRPRIFFMCLFVAAITLVVSPWTQDILGPSWKMSCDPFSVGHGNGQEASVTISASNYTEFCANVWRKEKDEFSAQAEAWKHAHTIPDVDTITKQEELRD